MKCGENVDPLEGWFSAKINLVKDQRFPHTSFFTTRNIKAGEELRWNYGYENNKTEGGECYCESNNCNGFYK